MSSKHEISAKVFAQMAFISVSHVLFLTQLCSSVLTKLTNTETNVCFINKYFLTFFDLQINNFSFLLTLNSKFLSLCLVEQVTNVVLYSNDKYVKSVAKEETKWVQLFLNTTFCLRDFYFDILAEWIDAASWFVHSNHRLYKRNGRSLESEKWSQNGIALNLYSV